MLVLYCLRIPKGLIVSNSGYLTCSCYPILLNGMHPRILARVVNWVRAHRQFSVDFSTHGSASWVYNRTWKTGEFVRVAVAIIDRFFRDASSELAILGKILSTVGSGASLVSLFGGYHTLWW